MPRANRIMQPGLIYHLTHRCHDREYLFRFARDRSEYLKRLRSASREFDVSLLNFCVTSNHTHQIAVQARAGGISRMMQKTEGEFAAHYNRRKRRSGSFWEDRYHCTMVEDGEHLRNCMLYVDLNMVRAAVVAHPREWHWCGYQELAGMKKRCRLLNVELLLELLGHPDLDSFRKVYDDQMTAALEARRLQRERRWTESIAVGSETYVKQIAAALKQRRRSIKLEEETDGSWIVRESTAPYHAQEFGRQGHGGCRMGTSLKMAPVIGSYTVMKAQK